MRTPEDDMRNFVIVTWILLILGDCASIYGIIASSFRHNVLMIVICSILTFFLSGGILKRIEDYWL